MVYNRKLKNTTVADKHQIPRLQGRFRSLEKAQYYLILVMTQGHFQIPIKQEDQYKTNFNKYGLFSFKRISQGFKNVAPIFKGL